MAGNEEEEEAGDGIYLLVTNSQKIAQANAAVRYVLRFYKLISAPPLYTHV